MFQFPAFASYPYVFRIRYLATMLGNPGRPKTDWIFQAFEVGFPIRISMDQSLFAAPHGFSQRITSFFACACQGIHQMPLNHFFVLIANAHPCLIWQTQPLTSVSGVPNLAIRARSPLRVPLLLPKTRSLLTIKQETNDTVTFYNHV